MPTTSNEPAPITVFGRTTCEDTAIVRDRLNRLGVPFHEVDIEADEGAARLVESLNDGNRVTPTLLFGGTEGAVAEPSIDDLDQRLIDEGWAIHRPEPTQYQGDLVAAPVPLMALVGPDGAEFRLAHLRGRHEIAVFFAHAADCMTCSGYARQLAAGPVAAKLADAGARAFVVVPGDAQVAARWRAESTDKVPIVADPGGRWKEAVTARMAPAADSGGAMLVGLDRYLAPRIGSIAPDAGGLATPLQTAEWLQFVALECAECGPPLGWTEET